MPVYTYRCENCGVQFDKTQKFTDQSLTRCPECGKKSLRKVYQPVGIVFKGSGFYSTDNRSPSGASRSSTSHSEDKEPSHNEDKESRRMEDKESRRVEEKESRHIEEKESSHTEDKVKPAETKSTDSSTTTPTSEKAEKKD